MINPDVTCVGIPVHDLPMYLLVLSNIPAGDRERLTAGGTATGEGQLAGGRWLTLPVGK